LDEQIVENDHTKPDAGAEKSARRNASVTPDRIDKTTACTNICEMNAVRYWGLQSVKIAYRDHDVLENSLHRGISPYIRQVNIVSWTEDIEQ